MQKSFQSGSLIDHGSTSLEGLVRINFNEVLKEDDKIEDFQVMEF